ncbi:MAG TPA: hypothetical protein ENJ87_00875 [Gammaproteobacteria bacterium]|nr:hypothetical protein [Gammaproteobacteria bacterium]
MFTRFSFKRVIFVPALFFLLSSGFVWNTGCSYSGSGAKEYKDFYSNLGLANAADLEKIVFRMLDKHQYEIVRRTNSQEKIYYETAWRPRYPFDDEVKLGVSSARSRIIITARPRDFGGTGTFTIYRVKFYAENEVRFSDTSGYTRIPISKKAKKYFRRIAGDIRTEVNIEHHKAR